MRYSIILALLTVFLSSCKTGGSNDSEFKELHPGEGADHVSDGTDDQGRFNSTCEGESVGGEVKRVEFQFKMKSDVTFKTDYSKKYREINSTIDGSIVDLCQASISNLNGEHEDVILPVHIKAADPYLVQFGCLNLNTPRSIGRYGSQISFLVKELDGESSGFLLHCTFFTNREITHAELIEKFKGTISVR